MDDIFNSDIPVKNIFADDALFYFSHSGSATPGAPECIVTTLDMRFIGIIIAFV